MARKPKPVSATKIARWVRAICPEAGCSVLVSVTEDVTLATGQARPSVTHKYSITAFAGPTPEKARLWLKWEGNSVRRFRRSLEARARIVEGHTC